MFRLPFPFPFNDPLHSAQQALVSQDHSRSSQHTAQASAGEPNHIYPKIVTTASKRAGLRLVHGRCSVSSRDRCSMSVRLLHTTSASAVSAACNRMWSKAPSSCRWARHGRMTAGLASPAGTPQVIWSRRDARVLVAIAIAVAASQVVVSIADAIPVPCSDEHLGSDWGFTAAPGIKGAHHSIVAQSAGMSAAL